MSRLGLRDLFARLRNSSGLGRRGGIGRAVRLERRLRGTSPVPAARIDAPSIPRLGQLRRTTADAPVRVRVRHRPTPLRRLLGWLPGRRWTGTRDRAPIGVRTAERARPPDAEARADRATVRRTPTPPRTRGGIFWHIVSAPSRRRAPTMSEPTDGSPTSDDA